MSKKNKRKNEQLEAKLLGYKLELQRAKRKMLLLALEVREAIFDAEQYGVEIINASAAVRARAIAVEILSEVKVKV